MHRVLLKLKDEVGHKGVGETLAELFGFFNYSQALFSL
jgi:hypothetical protein